MPIIIPDEPTAEKTGATGATGAVGATTGAKKPEFTPTRTALDVMLNPQGSLETLLSFPLSMALTGGGGAVAEQAALKLGLPAALQKIAPAVGRVLTQGAQGAASAAQRGQGAEGAAQSFGLDASIAAIAEALLGRFAQPGKTAVQEYRQLTQGDERLFEKATEAWRKVSDKAARQQAQFTQAVKDPVEAAQILVQQLGTPGLKVTVPSLSSSPITIHDAAQSLSRLRGRDYQATLTEIVSALDQVQPGLGHIFRSRVSPYLIEPTAVPGPKPTLRQRPAPEPRSALMASDPLRAGVDALLGQEYGGYPRGLYLGKRIMDAPMEAIRSIGGAIRGPVQ